MALQNATNGGTLINKIFVTGTFNTNGQVPTYNSGVFNPGVGGGGSTWGFITGTLSNQTDLNTALSNKQNTITTGTITEYFRGDLSLSTFTNDVRAVDLTGLTSTNGTISSTDNILTAFGKALKGIADVNTRIDNLTPPNTGFFNGGENASANRTLGNTTNYSLSLITNNQARIKITGTGLINITDNIGEFAIPAAYVQPGSLVISGRTKSFGGGTKGWNSNTAQLILEFATSTEFAGSHDYGLVSFFQYERNNTVPYKRMIIGRNMGDGRIDMLHNASYSFFQGQSTFSISAHGDLSTYLTTNTRPNISIGGAYPHLFLISQGTLLSDNSNAIKQTTVANDGVHRHLNQGQRNSGKYYSIAYCEGVDYNPHMALDNTTGTIQYVMPSYSNSNILSSAIGQGINVDAASILYNLHIRGTNTTNGTIGWGLNDGCRTEVKNNASATDRLGKQSGFFRTNALVPSNYFLGVSNTALLIDCRLDDSINGLQIAGNYDSDDLWTRKIGRTWYKLLTTLNGWSRLGNDLTNNSSDNKIGSTSAHSVIAICNNLEVFRLDTTRPRRILIDTTGGLGTASTPNYSFSGNSGENAGMFYKTTNTLSFSTGNTERLEITDSVINTTLPFNIAGSTQELRIGGTKVLGARLSTISSITNTATGTQIATAVNSIISRLQTHGLIS